MTGALADVMARRRRLGVSPAPPVVLRRWIPPPKPVVVVNPVLANLGIGILPRTKDSVRRIVAAVADASGVHADLILSPVRSRKVVRARHAAVFIASRAVTHRRSILWISREFGRDHSTVNHTIGLVSANIDDFAPLIRAAAARIEWK